MNRQMALACMLLLSVSLMGQKTWKDYGLVHFEEIKDGRTLFGLKNLAGTVVLPAKYEDLELKLTNGFAGCFTAKGGPFKAQELEALYKAKKLEWLVGLIDSTGKVVVEPIYDDINLPFRENITEVEKDGLYGLITKKGKVLTPDFVPEKYLLATHHYFLVKSKSKSGLINIKGEQVIPILYDTIDEYSYYEGDDLWFCLVGNAGKWGLYSVKGKSLAIPVAYDNINYRGDDFVILENQKKFGMFDLKKKLVVIPVIYSGLNTMYYPFLTVIKEGKAGLINVKTQKTLIPCLYKGYFMPIYFGNPESGDKLAGFLAIEEIREMKDGEANDEEEYDEEEYDEEEDDYGMDAVPERVGLFDANGKLLLAQIYDGGRYIRSIHMFIANSDLLFGRMEKGKDEDSTYCAGYWMLNGKTNVFKSSTAKFKQVYFNDDAAMNVLVQTMDGKWGLINAQTDKFLVQPIAGECDYYDDDHSFAITNGTETKKFDYFGKELPL